MALTERPFGYPKPTETADYQKQNAILEAFLNDCNRTYKIDFDNDLIRAGSIFFLGGILLEAESNQSISGTTSDIVKIKISDYTAEYVSSMTGIEWNNAYNGYYDSDGNLYIISESLEKLNNEITDLKTIKEKTFLDLYMTVFKTPIIDMQFDFGNNAFTTGIMISNTQCAGFKSGFPYLQTYEIDFINRTVSLVGNYLNIVGGVAKLIKLDTDIVAFAYTNATTWTIKAYEFDGTDWAQKGNTLSLSGKSGESSDFVQLAENTCALVTQTEMTKYEFDGSDFNQIGNTLTVSFLRPRIASREDDLIFVVEETNDTITVYRFDGEDWNIEGNPYTFSVTTAYKELLCVGERIYYTDLDSITILTYDGEDFTMIYEQGLKAETEFSDMFNVNDRNFICIRNGMQYFGEAEY